MKGDDVTFHRDRGTMRATSSASGHRIHGRSGITIDVRVDGRQVSRSWVINEMSAIGLRMVRKLRRKRRLARRRKHGRWGT